MPENVVYLVHELIDFEKHGKCHPEYYGEYLGEFLTRPDAKRWLRDHETSGAFAIVERVNGKIGRSWPYEIDPSEIDDDAAVDDDLALLDPDDIDLDDSDLLNPEVVRSKIKIAKLQAELNASRNGAHSGFGELLEGVKFVEEIRKQAAPQKSLAEQVAEAKQVAAMFDPPRRENPAPQPQRSEEEVLLSTLARNPDVIEKLTGGVFRKLLGGESGHDPEPWYADTVRELVKSGEASKIAGAVIGGLSNLIGSIIKTAPVPQPQQTAQPPQQHTPQPAPQVTQADAQALPASASDQQPQAEAAQPEQVQQITPADELIYALIGLMEKQAPTAEAQNIINISVVRHPELGDSIDELLNLSVDQILMLLAAYHPPVAQMSHARTWLESLIEALTAEESGEAGDAAP